MEGLIENLPEENCCLIIFSDQLLRLKSLSNQIEVLKKDVLVIDMKAL